MKTIIIDMKAAFPVAFLGFGFLFVAIFSIILSRDDNLPLFLYGLFVIGLVGWCFFTSVMSVKEAYFNRTKKINEKISAIIDKAKKEILISINKKSFIGDYLPIELIEKALSKRLLIRIIVGPNIVDLNDSNLRNIKNCIRIDPANPVATFIVVDKENIIWNHNLYFNPVTGIYLREKFVSTLQILAPLPT